MNNTTFVHKYIKSLLKKDYAVVDMTLGNGNDTLFLANKVKKVYAIDIAKEAINKSKKILKDFNNIVYICDNHTNVDKYIEDEINLFIFNLGYLPHSDIISVTNKNDTLKAFIKAYKLLMPGGYIAITFYLGHSGGKDEYYHLDKYIKDNNILVLEKYKQDKIDSPITYIIKKLI